MLLFEVKVTDLNSDKEVGYTSMIGDIAELKDKGSVLEIMESMGNIIVQFNSDKKGKVE